MGKVEYPAKVVITKEEGKRDSAVLLIGGEFAAPFEWVSYDIDVEKSTIRASDERKYPDYNKGFVDGYKQGIEAGREILADQVRKALEKRVIHVDKVGDEE